MESSRSDEVKPPSCSSIKPDGKNKSQISEPSVSDISHRSKREIDRSIIATLSDSSLSLMKDSGLIGKIDDIHQM